LGVSAEAMKTDTERIRRLRLRDLKRKQSQEAQMSLKSFGDRINVDAAKNIRANHAEETLLGLMLIYEDFRRDAAMGVAGIRPEDFITSFGRRVFDAICALENSEMGFSKAMLGQTFSMDELGRIEKIELARRNLVKNDREVFLAAIDAIRNESKAAQETADPFADLRRKQEHLKKAKENKNT
jgi:hypothetical protein